MKSVRCMVMSAALGALLLLAGTVSSAEAAARGDRLLHADFDALSAGRGTDLWHGQSVGAAAKVDTVYLLGGPGRLDGKFQDAGGQPAWHGWTSEDATLAPGDFWSVTAEPDLVIDGQFSLWCGTEYPEPGPIPVPGFGYGNRWAQNAVFSYTVPDNAVVSDVVWSLMLQHETEPGYDFVYLQWNRAGQWVTLEEFDGLSPGAIAVEHAFQVGPEDYVGPGADRIELRIRFYSDVAWSDEDGLWATERGACQVDDIAVSVQGEPVSITDFEDGTTGDWVFIPGPGVGDFAALYTNLGDLDPCRTNRSPQVAFIDDGVVVPGTGGTMCITWCYGTGGYIVNNTGGLLGGWPYLDNLIISPALESVPQLEGAVLAFDVYVHEEQGAFNAWPGMCYIWNVRSITSGDPADLQQATWRSRNFLLYGGPEYRRHHEVITDLLNPDWTHLQVGLRVVHWIAYQGGLFGIDGTPAPYFDNVAVAQHALTGPAITAREVDLAQDNFPAQPYLDFNDLASNAVRFDMARNIAPRWLPINRPGDSLIVDVKAVRAGTSLVDRPRMHVAMRANPVFDGVRVLPPGFSQTGDLVTGWVHGDSTFNVQGVLIADRWNFDLPDDDFFYPGDVIHYYFEAEDTGGGVTTLPGDLAGFGNFTDYLAYPNPFAVRALPGVTSPSFDGQPRLLFWDDSGGQGFSKWIFALRNSGFGDAEDYDLYQTNGATSGVGNGLGGRATVAHLTGYQVLVYTSGDLASRTLSDGNPYVDAGDDIGLVSAWLDTEWSGWGSRGALLSGDNLVSTLELSGPSGQALVADHLGVSLVNRDLRQFISGQTMPLVRAIPGNDTFWYVQEWIANGGCPQLNTMDALLVTDAQRLAEFTAPDGQSGYYQYAAATRRTDPVTNATVILLPYDLPALDNPPSYTPPAEVMGQPARAVVLTQILARLGLNSYPPLSVVPDAVFTASNHPNPLNPATTIALSVPHGGPVGVSVYNLRGALVRTLVDERLQAGRHEILWDGRDTRGALVASGVYFYEARYGGEVKVGKMTVVK